MFLGYQIDSLPFDPQNPQILVLQSIRDEESYFLTYVDNRESDFHSVSS